MAQLTAPGFGQTSETSQARASDEPDRRPLDLEPRGPRHLRKAWIALAISVLVAMVAAAGGGTFAILGFGAAALVALVGTGRGVAAVVRSFEPSSTLSGVSRFSAVLATLGNAFMLLFGSFAAYVSTFQFVRGRQIRSRGRVLLAPIEPGRGWLRAAAPVTDAAPTGVSAQWRENGRTEHASVGAFARLTLDLLALGAPATLVADAQRDALDEIRHTELCFDLATSMDGTKASPGPFPEAARARTLPSDRTLALAALAVDSLIDGALNEGVSARVVARLAKRVEDRGIQRILVDIAADEGRHAAHGWDVVLYCLAEGGEPVLRALQGAAVTIPDRMRPASSDAARRGDWEPWGIPGAALEDAEFQKARADIQRKIRALHV